MWWGMFRDIFGAVLRQVASRLIFMVFTVLSYWIFRFAAGLAGAEDGNSRPWPRLLESSNTCESENCLYSETGKRMCLVEYLLRTQ